MPNRNEVIAMGFAMPIVTCVTVCLRFYSRYQPTKIGVDDVLVAFAWAVLSVCCAFQLLGVFKYGYGQHSGNGTSVGGYHDNARLLTQTKRNSDIINFMIPWALMGCKLGLLLFYRRVFRGKWFSVCIWTTAFFVVGWVTAFFFSSIFQCGVHVSLVWGSAETIAKNCLSAAAPEMWNASWDVFCDLCIFLIPLYWIRKVQLTTTKKYLVTFLFAFGGLAIIASIIRLALYARIFPAHNKDPDQMQYVTSIIYWSILETGLAVIAACLPTYGKLLTASQKKRLGVALTRVFARSKDIDVEKSRGFSRKRGKDGTVLLLYNVGRSQRDLVRDDSGQSDERSISYGQSQTESQEVDSERQQISVLPATVVTKEDVAHQGGRSGRQASRGNM